LNRFQRQHQQVAVVAGQVNRGNDQHAEGERERHGAACASAGGEVTLFQASNLNNADIDADEPCHVPIITSRRLAQLLRGRLVAPGEMQAAWATRRRLGKVKMFAMAARTLCVHPTEAR
jgi:hypothetical protein